MGNHAGVHSPPSSIPPRGRGFPPWLQKTVGAPSPSKLLPAPRPLGALQVEEQEARGQLLARPLGCTRSAGILLPITHSKSSPVRSAQSPLSTPFC